MQRLSMIALAATAVLALSGAAFSVKPTASTPNQANTPTQTQTASPTGNMAEFANSYYWYSTLDGSYVDYESTSAEIYEMEMYWGCQVDQNPIGGTLLEEAFPVKNPNYPVMVWLYGHFD